MSLFPCELTGRASWGEVFCSAEAFSPLVHAVLKGEGLPDGEVTPLAPGTNAVFRVGELVIKLFAPPQSGFDTAEDYRTELSALEFARREGVPAPRVLARGRLQDRYLFRYLVLEYLPGTEASMPSLTPPEKVRLAGSLRDLLRRLNRPAPGVARPLSQIDLSEKYRRMEGLHPGLAWELQERTAAQRDACVLVHGDITRDNVVLGPDGSLKLLDFADSLLAPPCYELPPIVFDLFEGDPALVAAFARLWPGFEEALLDGISLHLFCGDILKLHFARLSISPQEIGSLRELRQSFSF